MNKNYYINVINNSDCELIFQQQGHGTEFLRFPNPEKYQLPIYSSDDPTVTVTVKLQTLRTREAHSVRLPGAVDITIDTKTGEITKISPSSLGCVDFDLTGDTKKGQILIVGNIRKRLKVVNNTDTDFVERHQFTPIDKYSVQYLSIAQELQLSTRDDHFHFQINFDKNTISKVSKKKCLFPQNGDCLGGQLGSIFIRWENNPGCDGATLYIEPSPGCMRYCP